MKTNVYVEECDFENFIKWFKRIQIGEYLISPVFFSTNKKRIKKPVNLTLEVDEYNLIKLVYTKLSNLNGVFGKIDIIHNINHKNNQLIGVQEIIQRGEIHNKLTELINYALETASQIPGITPLEALSIAENIILKKV